MTDASESGAAEASIGSRIKSAREYHEMSQSQLAIRLGVERATIATWENNKRAPRANRLVMLAGVLDVSLAWLLEGQDEQPASQPRASLADLREDLERVERQLSELTTVVAAARARLEDIS